MQTALPLTTLGVDRPMPDLASYEVLLLSSSGGKDSQAALDILHEAAQAVGVADRIVVVHADLKDVEWPGALELAAEHAAFYGLRFETVTWRTRDGREQTLLEAIEKRGQFPDAARRYCTSGAKRGPVRTLMTRLVNELLAQGLTDRPVRILSVLGIRAQESTARALKQPFRHDGGKHCTCPVCAAKPMEERGNGASNTRRHVDEWFNVFDLTTDEVWQRIAAAGTRPHPIYAHLPRLGCKFCVLAPRAALVVAARLDPEAAAGYAAVEERIGHSFKVDLSMAEIRRIAAQVAPAEKPVIEEWVG